VDRRVVSECSFDPGFGDFVALRNGVVVIFNARSDDAYGDSWQQHVVPRFVNAVMARIP
jgi:hypothetical protein